MCRMLAYAARSPRAAADLLGPEELSHFRELSRLHHDGWGMSWLVERDLPGQAAPPGNADEPGLRQEGRLRVKRSTRPAYEDPDFDALAGQALGRAGLVHLRWATPGLSVCPSNTHPFLAGGWAFAHQGSIKAPERLDALLAPQWAGRRRGTTDSERYFLLVLQSIEQQNDIVRGITEAVGVITSTCGPASLNAVLLSESSLVFVHGREDLDQPSAREMAAMAGEVPRDHADKYLKVRYRRGDGNVVVASSGLTEKGWEEMSPCSVLRADLDDMSVSLHDFEPGART